MSAPVLSLTPMPLVGEGGAQRRMRGDQNYPSPATLRVSTSPTRGEVNAFGDISKPMLKRLTILILILLVHSPFALAIPILPTIPITGETTIPEAAANFDQHFVKFMHYWQIPGAAVAIMKNNSLILARGYGWADLEKGEVVQPYSLFRIASVSKAITAVTTLQLIEKGKLNLDDKVFNILAQLSPLTNMKAKAGVYQITVRHLLQMSSGWFAGGSKDLDVMFGPWSGRMSKLLGHNLPPDCLTASRFMMGIPPQFTPGTQYSYSNLSYCMLGLIINKVTGNHGYQGYESYVQQQLLQPLGINDMEIGESNFQLRDPREVKYYRYEHDYKEGYIDGLPYGNSDILKKNYSDGGWIASAVSLSKFVHALGNHQLLSANMIKTMTSRPMCQNKIQKYFAMGWTVKYANGHRYFFKTGSFTGTAALIVQRDDGVSYAALFNTKPADRGRFVNQLQNILFSFV